MAYKRVKTANSRKDIFMQRNIFAILRKGMVVHLGVPAIAIVVAVVASAAFFTPTYGNVAKSETCANPPSVPTLNNFPVTFTNPGELCKDFPAISARVVSNGHYANSQAELDAGITAQSGDEIYVRVYVHNGAANNLDQSQTVARNVQVTTNVDTAVSSTHTLSVTMKGTNTNTVSKTFTIRTNSNERLEVISGSGEVFDYQANLLNSGLNIGNNTYTVGDMNACFEYSKFLRFKLRVVPTVTTTNITLEKLVRNVSTNTSLSHSTTARGGETAEYQIKVRNTGTVTANSVSLTDVFTNNAGYIGNRTGYSISRNFSGSLDNGGSLTLGSLEPNAETIVRYTAPVNNYSNTNSVNVCNTATVTSSNAGTATDTACVNINPNIQNQNILLNFSKKAWNDTKNVDAQSTPAAREDFITYTLTVTNTGNATAPNFVITDDLSGVLALADMVDKGGATLNGQTLSYPGIDIAAGQSVSRMFKVRVKYGLASNLSYVMRNTYGNTVNVTINVPVVFSAPKTGADMAGPAAIGFGGLVTSGFALLRRKGVKEVVKAIFS